MFDKEGPDRRENEGDVREHVQRFRRAGAEDLYLRHFVGLR